MNTQKDNLGEARAAASVAIGGVEDALGHWRSAPPDKKGEKAQDVLAHIGGLPGMRLDSFVDEETAEQIRADYKAWKVQK